MDSNGTTFLLVWHCSLRLMERDPTTLLSHAEEVKPHTHVFYITQQYQICCPFYTTKLLFSAWVYKYLYSIKLTT